MAKKMIDLGILDQKHFKNVWPLKYDGAWFSDIQGRIAVLEDDIFQRETENNSWSSEVEEIHEEPTRDGWILAKQTYWYSRILMPEISAISSFRDLRKQKLTDRSHRESRLRSMISPADAARQISKG